MKTYVSLMEIKTSSKELEALADLFWKGLTTGELEKDIKRPIILSSTIRAGLYRLVKSMDQELSIRDLNLARDIVLTKYREQLLEQGYNDELPDENTVLDFLTRKPAVADGY